MAVEYNCSETFINNTTCMISYMVWFEGHVTSSEPLWTVTHYPSLISLYVALMTSCAMPVQASQQAGKYKRQ